MSEVIHGRREKLILGREELKQLEAGDQLWSGGEPEDHCFCVGILQTARFFRFCFIF